MVRLDLSCGYQIHLKTNLFLPIFPQFIFDFDQPYRLEEEWFKINGYENEFQTQNQIYGADSMLKCTKLLYSSFFFLAIILFLPGEAISSPKNAKKIIAPSSMRMQDGWIFVHIEGKPYDRGFQYGYHLAKEIVRERDAFALEFKHDTKQSIDIYLNTVEKLYWDMIAPEYQDEMKGMMDGVIYAGQTITLREILMINTYYEMSLWWDTEGKKQFPEEQKEHCSAFIAVGDMTIGSEIVLAHNTWFGYNTAPFCKIMLEVVPQKGHKILMQNQVGMLFSATDFFITDAGLVGSETTIGKFKGFDIKGEPVAIRARRAMQYADTITGWVDLVSRGNNGAYANAWLLGDTRTKEIARLELGLKYESLERTRNGFFIGSNIAENPNILKEETTSDPNDLKKSNVSRRVRWQQLMRQYKGKIDAEAAKKMLADHFDSYLGLDQPSVRSLCGHPFVTALSPDDVDSGAGAFDGKVVTSDLARQWRFWARWGSSCDIGFDKKKFLDTHPKMEWAKDFYQDIPAEPWTMIAPEKSKSK